MPFYARLACSFVILTISLAAHAQTSAAADWRLLRRPQSAASSAPAAEPGQVTYLRRLVRDANAAAARGDDDEARRLAERAYQVSVSYRAILVDRTDCSPATMAALAQRYGSTVGLSGVRSSAQPSSPPPKLTSVSQTSPPDLLSLVEARFRKISQIETESRSSDVTNSRLLSGEEKSTQTELRPVASQSPATPAQAVSTARILFDQLFQRSPDVTSGNRKAVPTTNDGATVNDPLLTSAVGGERDAWNLDRNIADDADDSPASSAESAIPPAPPAIVEIEASTTPRPERLQIATRSQAEVQIPVERPDAAVGEPLQLVATTGSQPVQAADDEFSPGFEEIDPGESEGMLHASIPSDPPATLIGPAIVARDQSQPQPTDDDGSLAPTGVLHKLTRLTEIDWRSDHVERLALALGIAMLIGGFALFGLSFRWA